MKRTLGARTRMGFGGLVVAAVVSGTAAAAMPMPLFHLHARLAPVAGTKAADGDFDGTLATNVGGTMPRRAHHWQLAWKLRLPALGGPAAASVRIRATESATAVTRVLCTRCTSTAQGTLAMKWSQAIRIAGGHAVVVVRTSSARLRGTVGSTVHLERSSRR